MEVPIELCKSARVYRPDPIRRYLLLSVLIAFYAFSVPYCIRTAGEPRQIAMLQAQKLADEKWALESSTIDENSTNTVVELWEEEDFASPLVNLASPTVTSELVEEDEFDSDGSYAADYNTDQKKSGSGVASYVASYFGTTKEQKRAKQEFEQWQKEFQEKSGETVSLPPEYLPSAWACLALFMTATVHALFFLMGHWIVEFKAMSLYKKATSIDDQCVVLVKPPPNRGGAALVRVFRNKAIMGPNSGKNAPIPYQIEFQRQKYKYFTSSQLGDASQKFRNGVFTLSAYPVALPLEKYTSATGMRSDTEVDRQTAQWGKNHLNVALPSFLELLQLQLLSPLAIFQVFCALLWLMDEYWSYTLFTLASVVVYEATTVFQRTRTQKMLGGMAPKPSPIYAYRANRWTVVTTKDLLPGDIISLAFKKRVSSRKKAQAQAMLADLKADKKDAGANTSSTNDAATVSKATKPTASNNTATSSATSMDEIVPCDCLLLRGSAVVNEASLTGESVPQMKEALAAGASVSRGGMDDSKAQIASSTLPATDCLDMNGIHRVNTLFSGCSIVTVDGHPHSAFAKGGASNSPKASGLPTSQSNIDDDQVGVAQIPMPPDGGAVAYVLRTGFGSSQGTLLQMIEYSQQSVAGDARETGLALMMLFIFALIASGYVLKEGLRKQEKTTHELLIKCIIIITSVVPRQFPMQMAMAVNMALMALSKAGIFCTEPYRVPLAGKVSHCLFDKTGTLTTDQLVPVGIINGDAMRMSTATTTTTESQPELGPVITAHAETAVILAACHSLVVVDESTTDKTGATAEEADADLDDSPTATANALSSSNLVGDPIELAAIKGIDWHWDASSSTASPDGGVKRTQMGLRIANAQLLKLQAIPVAERQPTNVKKIASLNSEIQVLEKKLIEYTAKAGQAMYSTVQVLQRHHFSSKLQRMSVVCKCSKAVTGGSATKSKGAGNGSAGDYWYCLVKGSPEALKKLMLSSAVPDWYDCCYETMARKGLRVLALAFKKVIASAGEISPQDRPRQWVESELQFGGFIAFECKIRADSGIVMKALVQSDHNVAMLTGDALLTSLHVAVEVGICNAAKKGNLTLTAIKQQDNGVNEEVVDCSDENPTKSTEMCTTYEWTLRNDETGEQSSLPFEIENVDKLGKMYNLLTTEASFLSVVDSTGGKASPMWKHAGSFCVFARMSPQGKASIIQAIQEMNKDFHVFMCGDGGNDVGALKQADIGLALLAGHANANTTEDVSGGSSTSKVEQLAGGTSETMPTAVDGSKTTSTSTSLTETVSAEDKLNLHQRKMQVRNEAVNKARQAHMKEFQARYTKQQQLEMQEEIRIKTEAGDYFALFSVMKNQATKVKQAMAEENARFMAMHGQVWDPKKDGDGVEKTGIEKMMESADTGDAGGVPMVRPGDASVAAPFTSRIPSVRAVVDLIRQGRCTLLSALMQQQIMMLESTIAAYTLSALSLHNARSSERQMMASSWLIMTAAISFSYATPLDHMHPLRPLRSLFHPAIIVSTLGQAAIHIACMTLAVQWATDAMGPETLKEVTDFFRKAKANEIARDAHCGEDDFMCQMQAFWQAPFMPNLLNSVVFLVETSQMISVFFANYKGRPWMKGMLENHFLFLSVFACIGGVIIAAWEMIPQLNELLQLAPFPDDAFRYKVLLLVLSTIAGTFLWDRLCVFIFSRKTFMASMGEAGRTSFKDFVPVLTTLAKVAGGLVLLGTGNILLIGGAIWMYRSYTQKQKAIEAQKLLATP